GARPMRRAVERFLEDPLAEALLAGTIEEGDTVDALVKEDDAEISFKSQARKEEAASTES
ncbi:hypothetical protein OAG05_00545, partial [Akkermansiaceae bacterium]|nr:hypothetical protein [Akkermansiaceae bacterium]